MIRFKMPSLGADMKDGTLAEWRKQPGDFLQRGDIIADVDTQKGLIEIEVFSEGTLEKLLVQEGEKVPVGTVLALIRPVKGHEKEEEELPVTSVDLHPIEEAKPSELPKSTKERIKISPLARKIAEENHVDITQLKGTGPEGAIVKADIEKAVSKKGKEEAEPIDLKPVPPSVESIRMAVAAAMSRSNREIPHYYLEKRVDMSNTLEWLREANKNRPVQKRLLPLAVYIKAVAKALDEVPDLNAVWDNGLVRKNEINIGFVVSLRSGGIVVPSILQADSKTVDEIMDAINDIIPRARAFRLRSSELSESTFTISSIGEGGADKVYGIIYPPQVGIAGFGGISEQAFAVNGMLGIHPVMDITLAGDHRATDGLIGSRFLGALTKYLQNPENL
ncbi:dihydrolipoamide acetyltransferase family protein [Algoriphagus sp. CAU 1675]|uniref:dihydrolipoamide acetyltransferase family protein n=1 Tax=Algoriphagus sp. CAU 1675 TaxID=3032597 RepID=UPI0023DBCC88|nr:dihydrolipoamide acetyltransferase family protein [Algoriphagus sp. CAU 1675]MDF2156624.1 dihydrolipoamide acetyltransferase family protein [Algoriphagus sp. CAU 1675]